MSLRLMSGLPARVIAVLQDYLPAELNLIDAEEADGITTPDIAAGDYFEWDRQVLYNFPACTIRTVSSTPVEVLPEGFGKRVDAIHRLDIMFHARDEDAAGSEVTLQRLMHRYVNGAMRVLCVVYEALQTVADPTRHVEIVTWAGPATYGPEMPQEDGAVVRTATLPIDIRRREAR